MPLRIAETALDAVDKTSPEAETAARFLLERESRYRELATGVHRPGSPEDPEVYCRGCLDALRFLLPVGYGERLDLFLSGLAADRPKATLVAILAALSALDRDDPEVAYTHAKAAMAAYPNDPFTQKLARWAQAARDGGAESMSAEADLAGRFCPAPFENLETAPDGKVYVCCPAWLPVPIGNVGADSPDRIWNSEAARAIRASILDGSYRYCSRVHCPRITSRSLPTREAVTARRHRTILAEGRTWMAQGPRRVALSHDRSCNLSCPSCRTEVILARKEKQERLDAMAERVILPLARDARTIHVTGSGDPFASHHFRHLLKRLDPSAFPNLQVNLQTNGILLDLAAWEDLGLKGLVSRIAISVDAARAETYAEVRRGGTFPRLLENLAFVRELRRSGAIQHLRLDFVVQAMNFREMPDFVDLARGHGADGVKFQMNRNWGTFSPQEFADRHVGSPEHPRHGAFRAVLGDPRLAGDYVELWGMTDLRGPTPEADARQDRGTGTYAEIRAAWEAAGAPDRMGEAP